MYTNEAKLAERINILFEYTQEFLSILCSYLKSVSCSNTINFKIYKFECCCLMYILWQLLDRLSIYECGEVNVENLFLAGLVKDSNSSNEEKNNEDLSWGDFKQYVLNADHPLEALESVFKEAWCCQASLNIDDIKGNKDTIKRINNLLHDKDKGISWGQLFYQIYVVLLNILYLRNTHLVFDEARDLYTRLLIIFKGNKYLLFLRNIVLLQNQDLLNDFIKEIKSLTDENDTIHKIFSFIYGINNHSLKDSECILYDVAGKIYKNLLKWQDDAKERTKDLNNGIENDYLSLLYSVVYNIDGKDEDFKIVGSIYENYHNFLYQSSEWLS